MQDENHGCTHVLHPDTLNPKVLAAQYAVRGELYLRAVELQREGRDVIFTNGAQLSCQGRMACNAVNHQLQFVR
jgi:hypothetical protein